MGRVKVKGENGAMQQILLELRVHRMNEALMD